MAFPQVVTTAISQQDSATTVQTATLPASLVSGNLILAIQSINDDEVATVETGYTQATIIGGAADGGGLSQHVLVSYKVSDGTETVFASDTAGSERSVAALYQISGIHATAAVEIQFGTQASSAGQDPPSLTPTWGAEDTLWIAGASWESGVALTVTAAVPANYAGQLTQQTSTSGLAGQTLTVCSRELNAAAEDPGTGLTVDVADNGYGFTIAVRTAAAAGGFPPVGGVGLVGVPNG